MAAVTLMIGYETCYIAASLNGRHPFEPVLWDHPSLLEATRLPLSGRSSALLSH